MHSDFLSGGRPGFSQQGKGFGPSLDGSRLDASGTIAHTLLRDQDEQRAALVVTMDAAAVMISGDPQLQGAAAVSSSGVRSHIPTFTPGPYHGYRMVRQQSVPIWLCVWPPRWVAARNPGCIGGRAMICGTLSAHPSAK
jgi:hypothetical protein